MSQQMKSLCSGSGRAAAAVLTAFILLAADWAEASMSSGSSGSSGGGLSSSSRNSSSRSSRSGSSSGSEGDFGSSSGSDSPDSRDSGSRRNSSNRRSGSSRSSSSRGSGHGRGFSSGGKSGSKPEPAPFVFGTKFERDGVRPHGTVLSSTAFADLPGHTEAVPVNGTDYYRRDNTWYQRIEQDGWTCYAEIYPPAGARIASVPKDTIALDSNGRTYYATNDAIYINEPGAGYVVIEPPLGTSFDRLPAAATSGIAVVVNGTSYYRHLGLFYREEKGASGARYVVTKSPYMTEPSTGAGAPTIAAAAATPAVVPAMDLPAYGDTSAATQPPVPGSPRAAFLVPINAAESATER